jgi:hypothetical protein
MNSFDNKYFPKKDGIFLRHTVFLLSSDYTNTFNPFSIAKLILDLQFLITPHLKFKQRLDFHLEMIVLAF